MSAMFIKLENVHLVGLYCIIMLRCRVKKNMKLSFVCIGWKLGLHALDMWTEIFIGYHVKCALCW